MIRSQHIIPKDDIIKVTGTSLFPDIAMLADKSWEELKNLAITQVEWKGISTFRLTLSDG